MLSAWNRNRRIFAVIAGTLQLAGCAITTPTAPESVRERFSKNYPVRTLTGFTEGLVCMDQMFLARNVEPVYVTAAPIPDYSENRGGAGYAARDMMISAIAEMTRESATIRYVAFDRQTPDIVALQNSHPKKGALRVPDFFIRGAVTQINNAPYSKQIGDSINVGKTGVNFQGASIGGSASVSLSSVSLDLALGLVNNYQILPGVFSANTFSVEKNSNSDELSISLARIGAVYSVNENKAEALSLALRGLVEVGLIELFGKLYNLPYWECLAEIGENTPDKDASREKYAGMSPDERAAFVANQLVRQKLLESGTATVQEGRLSASFRKALMQYRMRYNLLGGNEVDFPLFDRLWKDEQRSRLAPAVTTSPQAAPVVPVTPAVPPSPEKVTAAPVAPAPAVAPAPSPSSASAVNELLVGPASTLRLISRQRFPASSEQRVRFIRLVAQANPGVFPDPKKAADQPLAQGTRLVLPVELNTAASATSSENSPTIRPASNPAPLSMKSPPAPDRPLLKPTGR